MAPAIPTIAEIIISTLIQETSYIALLPAMHIILLPEMFNTSFITNDTSLAEAMDGPTITWMQKLAKKKKASVAGTLIVKDKGFFYNRLVWVRKDQTLLHYDKCHLFSLAKEDKIFTKGEEKIRISGT